MKQPKEKQPPSGGKSTVQRIHKDPSPSGLQCATYKNIWQIKELVLNVGTRGNQKKKKTSVCISKKICSQLTNRSVGEKHLEQDSKSEHIPLKFQLFVIYCRSFSACVQFATTVFPGKTSLCVILWWNQTWTLRPNYTKHRVKHSGGSTKRLFFFRGS